MVCSSFLTLWLSAPWYSFWQWSILTVCTHTGSNSQWRNDHPWCVGAGGVHQSCLQVEGLCIQDQDDGHKEYIMLWVSRRLYLLRYWGLLRCNCVLFLINRHISPTKKLHAWWCKSHYHECKQQLNLLLEVTVHIIANWNGCITAKNLIWRMWHYDQALLHWFILTRYTKSTQYWKSDIQQKKHHSVLDESKGWPETSSWVHDYSGNDRGREQKWVISDHKKHC